MLPFAALRVAARFMCYCCRTSPKKKRSVEFSFEGCFDLRRLHHNLHQSSRLRCRSPNNFPRDVKVLWCRLARSPPLSVPTLCKRTVDKRLMNFVVESSNVIQRSEMDQIKLFSKECRAVQCIDQEYVRARQRSLSRDHGSSLTNLVGNERALVTAVSYPLC
jgi:hypothetical protein